MFRQRKTKNKYPKDLRVFLKKKVIIGQIESNQLKCSYSMFKCQDDNYNKTIIHYFDQLLLFNAAFFLVLRVLSFSHTYMNSNSSVGRSVVAVFSLYSLYIPVYSLLSFVIFSHTYFTSTIFFYS